MILYYTVHIHILPVTLWPCCWVWAWLRLVMVLIVSVRRIRNSSIIIFFVQVFSLIIFFITLNVKALIRSWVIHYSLRKKRKKFILRKLFRFRRVLKSQTKTKTEAERANEKPVEDNDRCKEPIKLEPFDSFIYIKFNHG